jgi:hypothetical protein
MGNASEDKADKGTPKDSWLARINILLTMTLAALGFWLNYTTQQQKQAFEAQKLAIENLQSQIAGNRDLREERGSREQLRFQLFDKVTVSLQEGDREHIEAARALVESLLSTREPAESELRLGLLRALYVRAPAAQREQLAETVKKEEVFRADQQELEQAARKEPSADPGDHARLAAYRIDIFYCGGAGSAANKGAADAFFRKLEGKVKLAKVRELAPSINASPGYGVNQSEVRYEGASEGPAADLLVTLLSPQGGPALSKRQVGNSTPWYLSVFACG